ncbi:sensor histidine kinase [Streptomyces avicenniae]|uniref:sensor histidine kinase n=1 Tax=Streptomyces avicenniae TaxID=500153 RepID=UPI00069C9D64|nr:sensor histidine kinase [Streptomyces avicenniae]
MPVVAGKRSGRWTTRRWLAVGVTTTLAVFAVLGAIGAWTLARTSESTRQLAEISSPSLVSAVWLERALIDQETGVRGYALSRRDDFLDPYREGRADEEAAARRLGELVVGDEQAQEDLRTVLARADDWREQLAEPIVNAPQDELAQLTADYTERGKTTFDAVRAAVTEQQRHLADVRDTARDNLRETQVVRNVVFTVIAVLIVTVTLLAYAATRRSVTRPLEVLSRDARRVAEGDFAHPITAPTGPADLAQLGGDVEDMRRRLSDELGFAERARARLDEQAMELRRSNDELEQFAYVASHDLQEPLRKVASFCQLLQRRYGGQLDDRADQYIGFAVDGANRMQVLINDLLLFSRVGRMNAESRPIDLDATLTSVLDALSVSVEETGTEVTHDPLPHVTGDASQLVMLFQNLVSNAVKFRAPDRAPRIHVGAERDGDLWRLSVTDNGIGIEPEYAERVFVIFQRLHTRDAYPGSGIGLAMCKKIVEYLGGTISVDPTHGDGTRIVFTLPAAPGHDAPPDSAPADATADQADDDRTAPGGGAEPGKVSVR